MWVTIAEFFDITAAHLVRSRLESSGIPVLIQNENVVGLRDPQFLGGPGALLQVPPDQVEHALDVLQREQPDALQDIQEKAVPEDETGDQWPAQPDKPIVLPSTTGYRSGLRVLGAFMLFSALVGLLILWLGHL